MGTTQETGPERIARLRRSRDLRLDEAKDVVPPRSYHLADFLPLPLSPHNAITHVEDWRVVCDPPRTKVCIYGAGSGRKEAPLDDPSWIVWAINLVPPYDAQSRLRCDVWFDLHQRVAQSEDDLRWIAACPVPIYVPPDLMSASPRAVRFPLEEIEAAFGGVHYWTCTFAYQIALAMFMGATDIGLYGVELALGTMRERTVEYACTSYWIGRAEERGIQIHRPQYWSMLGQHPARYGFEYTEEKDVVKLYTDKMKDAMLRQHDVAGTLDEDA